MRLLHRFLVLIFFACLLTVNGFSQMGAAQKITYDIDSTTLFNIKRDNVWDLLKEPGKWNEISNGHIARVETKKVGYNTKMTLVFPDSSRRTDMVTQFQPEYCFIVIQVKDPVPAGVTESYYTVVVNAVTENSCSVAYRIRAEGDAQGKAQLLRELKAEMIAILSGLKSKLGALIK